MIRKSWLDDAAETTLIDDRARSLGTFLEAMADGIIEAHELADQEAHGGGVDEGRRAAAGRNDAREGHATSVRDVGAEHHAGAPFAVRGQAEIEIRRIRPARDRP